MSSIFMAASCSLPTASSVTTQQSKLLQQSQTQRSRLYTAQSSIYDEAIMVENADGTLDGECPSIGYIPKPGVGQDKNVFLGIPCSVLQLHVAAFALLV